MKTDKKSQILSEQKIVSTDAHTFKDEIKEEQKWGSEQILVKNIDSGDYEVVNIEQSELNFQEKPSAQTRASLWNTYWQEVAKTDLKLLRLVLENNSLQLSKTLTQQPIELNSFTYIDGWTLLHHAVFKGSEPVIKILIQHKINLDALSNQMKRTALHQAVIANKIDIAQLLLQAGANPNIHDADGNTPAHYAAQLSYVEIFQLMLNCNSEINLKLKNNHQMTVIDCVRDQKIYQLIQSHIQSTPSLNQNQHLTSSNRRFLQSQDGIMFKRYSKNDLVQKFLFLNQNIPFNNKSSLVLNQHNNRMKESVESTSSSERRKKIYALGKNPSHWINKKGRRIASQSIYLMKESVLQNTQNQSINSESLQNYEILRQIGSGGFAEVFLARRKKSSKFFAIKRISKSKILQNNLKRYVYSQRNILIKCSHPFIVEAFSMFQDETFLYIAMEYCQCGDLLKAISNKGVFEQKQAKLYAAQVGLALQYLHSKNILFRDLKTANVLISKDGYVKVSDFGLAKETAISYTFLGSVQYLAPQMVVDTETKQHSKSIDWYLFGVMIFELLTGKAPFYSEKQEVMFKKIRQEKPVFPNSMSKQCKNLLSRLLEKEPQRRLGSVGDFEDIKNHEWFKEVSFQKVLQKQLLIESRSYDLGRFESSIKQSDLRRKIPIDDYVCYEKSEHFRSWNYIKPT